MSARVWKMSLVSSYDFGWSVRRYLPVAKMKLSAIESCCLSVNGPKCSRVYLAVMNTHIFVYHALT